MRGMLSAGSSNASPRLNAPTTSKKTPAISSQGEYALGVVDQVAVAFGASSASRGDVGPVLFVRVEDFFKRQLQMAQEQEDGVDAMT
jgi:hypothetical protein